MKKWRLLRNLKEVLKMGNVKKFRIKFSLCLIILRKISKKNSRKQKRSVFKDKSKSKINGQKR